MAYARASQAKLRGEAESVEHSVQAALLAWQEIQKHVGESHPHAARAKQTYDSALLVLVSEGQRQGRLDPQKGLRVRTQAGTQHIPVQLYGFNRSLSDDSHIVPVGPYQAKDLNHIYRCEGIGIPTIITNEKSKAEPFRRKKTAFAATLLLKPNLDSHPEIESDCVLEFYNPLEIDHLPADASSIRIAKDLSAPIARALNTTQRNYVRDFLQPGSVRPDEEGLFILEPYVAGKIPIVLSHGLLSDRLTWANFVNDLHARPWFHDRYQVWGFEYPTGMPFLQSAQLLRIQLRQLAQYLDPESRDLAMSQMVLVGHSMGGLISKTQISYSDDHIWNAISRIPFDQVIAEPEYLARLGDKVYFEPNPMIAKVVYIGTPHRGSALAQRLVGRLGSVLVKQPDELVSAHRRLINANPDAFSDEFTKRIPSSIDMLEPSSPLLNAVNRLRQSERVQTHSIIGNGRWMVGNGDSDGVVPVSSATRLDAMSETFVGEKHANLTRDPDTIDTLLQILKLHYQSLEREVGSQSTDQGSVDVMASGH
jgi:pimeloyl-ACP methyl ester carboxylesterase